MVNPGFEEFTQGPPPAGFSSRPSDLKLPGWNSPNLGTPDYFRGYGNAGVPHNWAGNALAQEGRAYAGIISGQSGKDSRIGGAYREYLQGSLSQPLTKGLFYQVEFYFRLSSNSGVSIDRIGLLFQDSAYFVGNDAVILRRPDVDFQYSESEIKGWERVTFRYKARGGERNFIIGNFYSDAETKSMTLNYRHGRNDMITGAAYFYIDYVKVEREISEQQPELIWMNGEPIITDKDYVMTNIQFAFDSYELLPGSFEVLDSIVSIMQSRPKWKVNIAGHCDDRGSAEYNLTLSKERANAVLQYFNGKGIVMSRMTAKGYGSDVPLRAGNDNYSWDVNRRVEIKFLSQ